jgi:hypothetical protein
VPLCRAHALMTALPWPFATWARLKIFLSRICQWHTALPLARSKCSESRSIRRVASRRRRRHKPFESVHSGVPEEYLGEVFEGGLGEQLGFAEAGGVILFAANADAQDGVASEDVEGSDKAADPESFVA